MNLTKDSIRFEKVKSRDGKDLKLFTSLYYHISVKSIPNGLMSYEAEPREEGNLIQLALNNLEDFETISYENEVIVGPMADQVLWTILPEVSSMENDYQLKVLSHPEAKLTYTHGSSWGGRYMELDVQNPENYNTGSTMYSSCLWHFKPSELPDYLTIHNSDHRRDPNFVTFSNEPSERGQLMQLGTKDLEHYAPKGIFRHDALWLFRPKLFELFAFITDFRFEEPSQTELAEASIPLLLLDQVLQQPQKERAFSTNVTEIFKLNFMQSFKPFLEKNIKIDPTHFDGSRQLPFLRGKPTLEFEKKYGSNTQFICVVESECKMKGEEEEELPQGLQQKFLSPDLKQVRVKGYCNMVKELEILFTASVKVTAVADVADSKDGLKIENVSIPDKAITEYLLKCKQFTGKVKVDGGGGSGDGNNKGAVYCEVSGRLRCHCAIDSYIDAQVIQ